MHTPQTHRRFSTVSILAALALALLAGACGSHTADETDAAAAPTEAPVATEVPTESPVAPAQQEDEEEHQQEPHQAVTQAAVLFPIASGQVESWQAALADLSGPNYAAYEASRGRFGLTQQTTVLQETPMGSFALIYMEGPDLAATSQAMATSPDEWDVEWREMTTDLHGTDFNDAEAISFETHLVLDTGNLDDEAKQATQPFNFFVPLNADDIDALQAQFADVMSQRGDEYRQARRDIGVLEEKVFLQDTVVGPGLVIYWEAPDPSASLQMLFGSTSEFDIWFQEQFAVNHAIDVELLKPIWSANQVVADFPARS